MADHPNILLQDIVKYRDGKKWKTRWCVLEKSSPVADQVIISLYHDFTTFRDINSRDTFTLSHSDFCGMECSLTIQRHPNVLSIISLQRIILLAFDRRDRMVEWGNKIRSSLGQVADHKFTISIPNRGKLPPGPATMYFCHNHLAITTSVPMKLLGAWHLKDISRFGNIEEGFAFEANKSSFSNAGIFVLLTDQGQFIKNIIDSVVRNDYFPVNTIRQSFESDTNMEDKPLLTYTNECAITVESPPEDKFERQELTKRDIVHCERNSFTKSVDDGSQRRSDQTVDIHDVFTDKSGSDCGGDSRKTSRDDSWIHRTSEEYEMRQTSKHSGVSKQSSYSSPKERFSGGHLEDYGVVSEINKSDDYTALAYRTQNLNINDVITSGANSRTAVLSRDLDPWGLNNSRWPTTGGQNQRNFTSGDIYLHNLRNSGQFHSPGMNVSSSQMRTSNPGVSTAIRDEDYELMAPLVSQRDRNDANVNMRRTLPARTDVGQNNMPLVRDVDYELMAPQKRQHSQSVGNTTRTNQGKTPYGQSRHLPQGYDTAAMHIDGRQHHTIVYSEDGRALIREAEYELMAPLSSPVRKNSEPVCAPIRDVDYELMLPQSKSSHAISSQGGLMPAAEKATPYRNLPTNSKIVQARHLELKQKLEKESSNQRKIETLTNSGPIRDAEYENMAPGKSSSQRPNELPLHLRADHLDYDVPSSSAKFIDFRNHITSVKEQSSLNGRNSDIFTVVEFPGSVSMRRHSRPLSPIKLDSSVPRPLPVTCKLLTPPSSPSSEEPIPKPLPVTCKLQGVEITETEVAVPVPFDHSQLVLPNTKRAELSPSPRSDGSSNGNGGSTLTRGSSESKSSRKSFLSHKRKRCTTEPCAAGSPSTTENNTSSGADTVEGKDSSKGKDGDDKTYQRKRSLTDPESVKARQKGKGKGSVRKSKKKGNGEKSSEKAENIQLSSLSAKDKESSSASDESSSKSSGFKGFKKTRRSSSAKEKVPVGALRLPRKYSLSETSDMYSRVSPGLTSNSGQLYRFEKRSQSFIDYPGSDRQRYRNTIFHRPRTGSEYEVVRRNGNNNNKGSEKKDVETELLGAVGGVCEEGNEVKPTTTLPTLAERRSQSPVGSMETLEHVLSSILSPASQDTPDRKSQASSTGDVLEEVMLGSETLVEQCSLGSTQERRRKISHSRTLSMPDCSNPWTIHETAILLQDAGVDGSAKGKEIELNTLKNDRIPAKDADDVEYAEIDFHATRKMASKR